ncbi:hypothetical protein ccbrp13_17720 [Ktedonobacteria bacterium brp13]|nr:hypothetical protein ccbrp13_17720 [Ktedonobacteria bacterium brp13]
MTSPSHGDSPLPNVSKRNAESFRGTHGDIGDSSYSSASKSADSLRRSLYTKGKGAPSLTDLLLEKIGKSVSYEEFARQLQKSPENFFATPTGSKWLMSESRGTFLETEFGKNWLKREGREWTDEMLDTISRKVQWIDGHRDNESEVSFKALKPFIELRPTEELNEKLTAFDKEIQRYEESYEELCEHEEPKAIDERMTQLDDQRDLYWKVLKERGQKGQLQPENRAYYVQHRKEEFSEEMLSMEWRHNEERDQFIQNALKERPYLQRGNKDTWREMLDYPQLKDAFLQEWYRSLHERQQNEKQERVPSLHERQQNEKNELQKRHNEEKRKFEQ